MPAEADQKKSFEKIIEEQLGTILSNEASISEKFLAITAIYSNAIEPILPVLTTVAPVLVSKVSRDILVPLCIMINDNVISEIRSDPNFIASQDKVFASTADKRMRIMKAYTKAGFTKQQAFIMMVEGEFLRKTPTNGHFEIVKNTLSAAANTQKNTKTE